ncbi:MAG: ferrous iron transport protein B [Nitrososphaerota archaeon]
MSACHKPSSTKKDDKVSFVMALAGNANVGKSTLFNQLTGLHQHVGNWPGKTVERCEGSLVVDGYAIDIIDLPGIYSLSTFSIEELISREYIVFDRPDVVINVVDASVLERNLYFTLQLLELQAPIVIALNMVDLAEDKGLSVDAKKLSELLGVPVVPTVASKGIGIYELIRQAINLAEHKIKLRPMNVTYSKDVEERIKKLMELLKDENIYYPIRFVAVKLLEGDEDIKRRVSKKVVETAEKLAKEIEEIRGIPAPIVIASERYAIIGKIIKEAQKVLAPYKIGLIEKIDQLLTHKILGYLIMVAVFFSSFYAIFTFGDYLSTILSEAFDTIKPSIISVTGEILWEGFFGGFIAGVTLLIPFVIPFYFLLSVLEDVGYLPRVAFLLDNVMHKVGLHGKAIIPLIMGYGCSVPACYACRIMETPRERLISAFAVTFIPCTARLVVIYGLVGTFVGIEWAYLLLLVNLVIVIGMAKLAFKVCPGESMGLIMEVPPLRLPALKTVLTQTWNNIKSIMYVVFPIYILGGGILAMLYSLNVLQPVEGLMAPLTVEWLGLPAYTGIPLLFGVVRKEMIIIMPAILFGTTNFELLFTPIQMITLAFVAMYYVPCVSTFMILKKEFGWKTACYIAISQLAFAMFIGGLFYRALHALL